VEIDPTESSNIYGGIILINEMGGPIYIDKIEFIPLTPTTTPPITGTVPDGIYQIVTALNNSSVVEPWYGNIYPIYNHIQISENVNANLQKWKFVYNASKKAYQIKFISEDYVLTRMGSGHVTFKRISLDNDNDQYWKIRDTGDGYFYIMNLDINKALDVIGSNTSNGTHVEMWNFNAGTNQKFRLKVIN
ncbi:RICIN domain-containing protein, partial [Bacillus mycoides]|uniref:RICIN domain-containing protein n=1 Tax=Bacillus mycoides TaxID=1405 RepID=UPI003D65AA74